MRCLCKECKICIPNENDDTFDCTSTIYPRKNMTWQQINAWRICFSYERRKEDLVNE